MPNHTHNLLVFEGPDAQLDAIFNRLTTITLSGDDVETSVGIPHLDFNRIVPMPPVLLKVVTGRTTIDGVTVNRWVREPDPEQPHAFFGGTDRLLTPAEEVEIQATGFTDWYEWSNAKWGTKWNAYDQDTEQSPGRLAFRFHTAWSEPSGYLAAMRPVIEALAPDVTMSCSSRYEHDGYESLEVHFGNPVDPADA